MAYAGVGVDFPGFFALVAGEKGVLVVAFFCFVLRGLGIRGFEEWWRKSTGWETYDCSYVLYYLIWWDLAIVFKEAAGYRIKVV